MCVLLIEWAVIGRIADAELVAALRFMARTTTFRLFGSVMAFTVLVLDKLNV